jgi:hypothetical protein
MVIRRLKRGHQIFRCSPTTYHPFVDSLRLLRLVGILVVLVGTLVFLEMSALLKVLALVEMLALPVVLWMLELVRVLAPVLWMPEPVRVPAPAPLVVLWMLELVKMLATTVVLWMLERVEVPLLVILASGALTYVNPLKGSTGSGVRANSLLLSYREGRENFPVLT